MAKAKIFYESDCNLSLLDGKTICVVLEHSTSEAQPAHGDWHFSVVLPPDTGRQGDVCRVRLTGIAKNGMAAEKI